MSVHSVFLPSVRRSSEITLRQTVVCATSHAHQHLRIHRDQSMQEWVEKSLPAKCDVVSPAIHDAFWSQASFFPAGTFGTGHRSRRAARQQAKVRLFVQQSWPPMKHFHLPFQTPRASLWPSVPFPEFHGESLRSSYLVVNLSLPASDALTDAPAFCSPPLAAIIMSFMSSSPELVARPWAP